MRTTRRKPSLSILSVFSKTGTAYCTANLEGRAAITDGIAFLACEERDLPVGGYVLGRGRDPKFYCVTDGIIPDFPVWKQVVPRVKKASACISSLTVIVRRGIELNPRKTDITYREVNAKGGVVNKILDRYVVMFEKAFGQAQVYSYGVNLPVLLRVRKKRAWMFVMPCRQ